MVAHTTGPFAHFDLTDRAQCILLAHAIQHYRSGNASTTNSNISNASQLRLATAGTIAQLMRSSPLVREVVRPFLGAQRSMIFNNLPTDLLTRARDMETYVTPDTFNPGSPEYAAGQNAWRDHVQKQRVLAATIINGEASGSGSPPGSSDNHQAYSDRDLSSKAESGGIDKHAYSTRDDRNGNIRKKQKQIDNDAVLARSLEAEQYSSRTSVGVPSRPNSEARFPRPA